ncbi:MAG: hypothetical protein ABIK37_02080 [candidate division WOR-3 bacterium]
MRHRATTVVQHGPGAFADAGVGVCPDRPSPEFLPTSEPVVRLPVLSRVPSG